MRKHVAWAAGPLMVLSLSSCGDSPHATGGSLVKKWAGCSCFKPDLSVKPANPAAVIGSNPMGDMELSSGHWSVDLPLPGGDLTLTARNISSTTDPTGFNSIDIDGPYTSMADARATLDSTADILGSTPEDLDALPLSASLDTSGPQAVEVPRRTLGYHTVEAVIAEQMDAAGPTTYSAQYTLSWSN